MRTRTNSMKGLICAVAVVATITSALAQGDVVYDNSSDPVLGTFFSRTHLLSLVIKLSYQEAQVLSPSSGLNTFPPMLLAQVSFDFVPTTVQWI